MLISSYIFNNLSHVKYCNQNCSIVGFRRGEKDNLFWYIRETFVYSFSHTIPRHRTPSKDTIDFRWTGPDVRLNETTYWTSSSSWAPIKIFSASMTIGSPYYVCCPLPLLHFSLITIYIYINLLKICLESIREADRGVDATGWRVRFLLEKIIYLIFSFIRSYSNKSKVGSSTQQAISLEFVGNLETELS